MPAAVSSSSLQPALRAMATRWRTGRAWWLAGARATVPPRWVAAWTGAGRPTLVLSRVGEAWTCARIEPRGATAIDVGPAGFSLPALAAWLGANGLGRNDVDLAVALSRDAFFLRPLTLPEAALPRLDAILGQDLVRCTPFARNEVWHGGEVLAGTGPVRTVHHWIVRRDLVLQALAALGLDVAAVDAVAVAGEAEPPRPVIWLRDGGGAGAGTRPSRLLGALGLAALLATGVALAAADTAESLRAGQIADALAEARLEAEGGAAGGRDLRALLSIKALPGFGVAWAELSRIVPDDTVLTELRLDDGQFAIRGASSNAAALVRIVDASPLFTAATLTGGIAPNAESGRDQFGLSFDLRAKPNRKARLPAGMPR